MSKKDEKTTLKTLTRVRDAVKEAGGIKELADQLGVPCSTVWRWYVGKTVPSPLALHRLKELGQL